MKKILILMFVLVSIIAYGQTNTIRPDLKTEERLVIDYGYDENNNHTYRAFYKDGYIEYIVTESGDTKGNVYLYDYTGVENVYAESMVTRGDDTLHRGILLDIDSKLVDKLVRKKEGNISCDIFKNNAFREKGNDIALLVWYTRNGKETYMNIGIKHY